MSQQIVPLGENHLRTAVRSYVTHYHLERNHQGLDNRLISEVPDTWLETPSAENPLDFSPDSNWVAYVSIDPGDGKEIFFASQGRGSLWSAAVRMSTSFASDLSR